MDGQEWAVGSRRRRPPWHGREPGREYDAQCRDPRLGCEDARVSGGRVRHLVAGRSDQRSQVVGPGYTARLHRRTLRLTPPDTGGPRRNGDRRPDAQLDSRTIRGRPLDRKGSGIRTKARAALPHPPPAAAESFDSLRGRQRDILRTGTDHRRAHPALLRVWTGECDPLL